MEYGTIVDVVGGGHGPGFRGRFVERRGEQLVVATGSGARFVPADSVGEVPEAELERVRAINRLNEIRYAENERRRRAGLPRIFT